MSESEADDHNPARSDAKRSRTADDGSNMPKLPRMQTVVAHPSVITEVAQPLQAAAADLRHHQSHRRVGVGFNLQRWSGCSCV